MQLLNRSGVVSVLAVLAAGPAPAGRADVPAWAYPVAPSTLTASPSAEADERPRRVPDSTLELTSRQFAAHTTAVPDWHPHEHPAMPKIVSIGREPQVWACAYCHLPNGAGRPENTSLAGLAPGYFKQQLADFKHGKRAGSEPQRSPQNFMIAVAKALTDEEAAQAAAYFASLEPESFVTVVETQFVPKTYVAGAMLARIPGAGDEPISGRIIEVPEDIERAENRDSRTPYRVYAPTGSLARGAALASGKSGKTAQCSLCHGPELRGLGDVPRLAGRSPSYLMRQLYDFRSGTRTGVSGLMKPVAASLSQADMIDLSAYVASLRP